MLPVGTGHICFKTKGSDNFCPFSFCTRPSHQVRLAKPSHSDSVVVRLRGDGSSLVWAEWALQFPSFGCVLHQLLCLCKTCNVFAHRDSTRNVRTVNLGFFLSRATMSCKARRVTGSGSVSESGSTLSVQYYGAEPAHVWDILIDSLS